MPSFPAREVALYKGRHIENLKVQHQDTAFLAGEQFDRIVCSDHPYEASASASESVFALSRNRLIAFRRQNFTPARTVLLIVGDFDSVMVEAKKRTIFGVWKSSAKMPERDSATELKIWIC